MEEVKERMKEVWEREEKYWFQRARVDWLKYEEKNTIFFHQTTIQRRRKNKILRVRDENEVWWEEEKKVNYFKDLFKTNGERGWGQVMDNVPVLVNEDMNEELIKEVKEKEVTKAVFQLGVYKAPGPDGFSEVLF
ncbi:hypothetical protein CRYUN_Cryun37aG0000600 [Craigia yunnanensis]